MFNILKIVKLIIFNSSILLIMFLSNCLYAENIDIFAYESSNNIRLILNSKNSLLSNVFILKNPSRLVLDIKNVNNISKNKTNIHS